jgi:hypothetical protein
VRFLATSETKRISALAVYIRLSRVFVLNTVITTLIRTPTNILVIISISLAVPLHVRLKIFILEVLLELRVRYHNITHVLRTFAEHTMRSISYFLPQVPKPVLFAELMTTRQTIRAAAVPR